MNRRDLRGGHRGFELEAARIDNTECRHAGTNDISSTDIALADDTSERRPDLGTRQRFLGLHETGLRIRKSRSCLRVLLDDTLVVPLGDRAGGQQSVHALHLPVGIVGRELRRGDRCLGRRIGVANGHSVEAGQDLIGGNMLTLVGEYFHDRPANLGSQLCVASRDECP